MSRPLRIALIAPFPAAAVLPPDAIKPKYLHREHPAPWVGLLTEALARRDDTLVRVFVDSRAITAPHQAEWRGATFSFTAKAEPLRSDPLHLFLPGQHRLSGPVRQFAPDVVVGFGSENGSALIASRLPFPSIMFIQGIQAYTLQFARRAAAWCALATAVERSAIRHVDGAVAETSFARVWAARYQPAEHIRTIPHPLNPAFLETPAGHRDPIALAVGTLHLLKGMDTVIRAFAACSVAPARLLIAGHGPDLHTLRQLAYTLGVGHRTTFLGYVPPDQVRALMAQARLLVMGSRVDTSPNTITEAHASAVPVVATRAGGIPDMVAEGVDGYLVDIDDHQTMALRMQLLLEDAELARRQGEAGRAKVRVENDPDRIAAAHLDFYRFILQRSTRAGASSPCAA